tara:strand:+ start:486 stop:962 length:477 start_codon:yes stop_codon:yes gene_type:complete
MTRVEQYSQCRLTGEGSTERRYHIPRENEVADENKKPADLDNLVEVKGCLYEVNLETRKCEPLYWGEAVRHHGLLPQKEDVTAAKEQMEEWKGAEDAEKQGKRKGKSEKREGKGNETGGRKAPMLEGKIEPQNDLKGMVLCAKLPIEIARRCLEKLLL